MPITIYNNASDKKVIGKTLTSVTTLNYILLESTNIINPEIVVSYASNILSANYAYIAEFNRYYFIDSITILDGKRMKISMSVDVLETYKTQIKGLTCIVKRNSNVYNLYLDDPYFQALNKRQIQTKIINSSAFHPSILANTTDCFVLTIARG